MKPRQSPLDLIGEKIQGLLFSNLQGVNMKSEFDSKTAVGNTAFMAALLDVTERSIGYAVERGMPVRNPASRAEATTTNSRCPWHCAGTLVDKRASNGAWYRPEWSKRH
jgi:hypothetical protein